MTKSRRSSHRQKASSPHRGGTGARDTAPRRAKRGFTIDRWLLALVCVAALIRLWGIHDRLPDPTLGINVLEDTAIEETDRTTMGRAWTLWKGGVQPLDLNPHTGGWPALSFYVTLGIQWLYRVGYAIAHPGVNADRFAAWVINKNAARDLFLLARIIGAMIGVLTVALTYRLGTVVAGRLVGFGAAILLALNLPHILVSQHVSDPNLLALLFVLLACFPMVRIARGQGSTRDSAIAGAMIGLAGACKYVPLIVGLPYLFAHPRGLRNRALWIGVLAAAVALFLATPFTFLDWKQTLRDLTAQRNALFSSWVGQSEFPISLPTYLITTIPHAMGWPAYLLSIAGCVLMWGRGRAERVLVGTAVVLVVINGLLKAAQERYVVLAMPILCVAAAVAFVAAIAWWRVRAGARRPSLSRAAPWVVAALTLGWSLPELVQIRSTLSQPDTRHVARRWILQNVPPDAPMVNELYGAVFAPGERAFIIWPFFATQVPLVRPAFHPEFLDGYRYIAQSHGISARFEADSANYPVEVAYYRWLRRHAPLLWSTAHTKASGPRIDVRLIPYPLSTRATRDSLFQALMPVPNHTTRLALWCLDMSTLFGRMNELDRSEEWARRGLQVDARNMNGQLQIAHALTLLRLRRPAEGERAARTAVTLVPDNFMAHFYYGLALRDVGRPEDGLAEIRKAYAMSLDNRVRIQIGELLVELKRYEEAAREFEAVPAGIPERSEARRDLGIVYIQHLGRRDEGIAALREAAELSQDPRDVAAIKAEVARVTNLPPAR